MRRTTIIVFVVAAALFSGHAIADTTTPIVPNRLGHWLNLEYRSGTLAPEIADNPRLIETILIVERSFAKIDAFLTQNHAVAGCLQLDLPYFRIRHETVRQETADGTIIATAREVRIRETLAVRVCSNGVQRSVAWALDGDLFIVTRPRNQIGNFSLTLYLVQQISVEEREQTARRNARLVARNKEPKLPSVTTLYLPPIAVSEGRAANPFLLVFGAEFSSPPPLTHAQGDQCPTCGSGVHSSEAGHQKGQPPRPR
jgi:hypothetical protein